MTDESIFAAARAIPDPAQRAAYLDRACAGDPALRREVEELLAADAASNLLDRPPAGLPLTGAYTPGPESVSPHDPKADAGAVLGGRYKLVEPIGEGGMGTVWATQQTEPVRRAVAVKLIKAGMDSKAVLARFEAERQALALMDHPNIAKVLDAGAAPDGRPFFVMELVKGVPITRFCDDRRLTPRERLELFIPVCQAVQHAHQKGVIHRDIKPSNVLVALYDDRPVPKVIDFGVAKAAGSPLTDKTLMTGFGAVVGTPEYMSPEQASFNQLDIDTRADIYALGVLLYELLTGSTPVDRKTLGQAALLEVLRIVREVDPPRPSQKLSTADALPSIAANRHTEPRRLAALVKGDLDWIVMKALEKDRTRRYETANGLAADVGRYLAGEPVAAAPPSRTYRVRKFVRRTRGPVMVAAGAVAVLVALVGVLAVGIIQRDAANRKVQAALVRESDARKRTRAALDTLTSDALEGWFTRERVLTPDQKDVLRRLLDQYAAFAEEAGDDPDTKRGQVRALLRVGNIQQALGDRPAAGASLRRAVELAGTAAAPATDDPEGWRLAADAHRGLGSFYFAGGQWADAERHNREALAAAVRHRDADPTQPELRYRAALIRASLEAALGAQNRLDESEAEGRTQMAELQQLVDEFPRRTAYLILLAEGLHNRAIHSQRRGRVEQAEREVRRSIELTREWLVAAPNGVAGSKNLANALAVRANLLETMERLPEAESVRREAIATWAKLADDWASVPEYRRRLAECYFDQARGLGLQGRLPEAAEQGRRSVAAARQLAAEFPGDLTTGLFLARGQYDLSRAERRTRNWAAAVAAARGALAETDRLVAVHGPHLDTAWVRANALGVLAFLLEDRVSHQEAVAHAREAVDLRVQVDRDRPTPDHRSELCNSRRELAGFLASLGKVDEAESQLRAAIEESANLPPAARDEFWAATVFELTKVVSRAGRWGEAERWAGQAVDEFTRRHNQHPDNDQWRQACVQSHWHRGTARDRLGRYAEAAADWGTAADLADAQMDKAFYRAHRGASVARSGDAAGAAPELAAAIRLAEAALKADESSGILFYDAAAVYALAAVGAADPAAADRYAAEAVRLLGRAAGVGYLNDPAQVRTMRAADEYVALHPRADFRALLRTLPGGLDTAPPPRERR